MTIIFDDYTVAGNYPLNHARILYDFWEGDQEDPQGENPEYAANDYTYQQWQMKEDSNHWHKTTDTPTEVDCLFFAGHDLAGKTCSVETATTSGGSRSTKTTFVFPDNSPTMILFNDGSGDPYTVGELKLNFPEGDEGSVAIIRLGKALQMERPFYAGHTPLLKGRNTTGDQSFSDTGQWLGRTEKFLNYSTTYKWNNLETEWYNETFQPFSDTVPLHPFAIAGNPLRMEDDVGWCWANSDLTPSKSGTRALMSVSMDVKGYGG